MCVFGKAECQGEKERGRGVDRDLSSQWLYKPDVSQAKATQELHPGLSCGGQGPKYLDC